MGDRRQKDQDRDKLRARARELLDGGLLPRAKAARTWGGHGSGLACNLCDAAIGSSEPEMELEFDGSASPRGLRFHLQCHSIWDAERRAPTQGAWTHTEKAPPPFDAVVEGRVSMGAGRAVILSVMRVKNRGGDTSWVNATTRAPLPTAWRPVEWRYPVAEPVAPAVETPKRA